MARSRGNAALLAQENLDLTPEETKTMEDNRTTEIEEKASEPVSGASETQPSSPASPTAPEQTTATAPTPPAAQSTTAPVAATTETSQTTPQDDKKRMVEFGAFHEERERRKQEAARAQKAEQELARLTGRFTTLEELARAAAAQQQPQPKSPDVNTDPVGHFQAEIAKRDQQIAAFENWAREQQRFSQEQVQRQQQEQQIVAIRTRAVSQEQEFAKTTPDYTEAADYVQRVRNAQLEAIGFTDPVARQQQLAMEALNLAISAEQRGQNAAAIIYQMAKATGWAPKAPAAAASTTAQAAPQAPATADGAKKLETVAKGQQANTSLGKLNGQAAPAETSLEALLKMSDEDFDKATKGDAWRKLFT